MSEEVFWEFLRASVDCNIRRPSSPDQHVTRGHNIVADGWAGASNPHPNPNFHPKILFFPLDPIWMDEQTDRRTDGQSLLELRVRDYKHVTANDVLIIHVAEIRQYTLGSLNWIELD